MGLNFQTCTIINSNVDLDSKGKVLFEGVNTKVDGKEVKALKVKRDFLFVKDNVKSIRMRAGYEPMACKAEVDFDELDIIPEKGNNYCRLDVYVKWDGQELFYGANQMHIQKGIPFWVEFTVKDSDSPSKVAENIAKQIKKNHLFLIDKDILEVSVEGSVLKLEGTAEYQRIAEIKVSKFQLTDDYAEEVAKLGDDGIAEIQKGYNGFGTYSQIIKDLRLPTAANYQWTHIRQAETPIVGAIYNQYIIEYCAPATNEGTQFVGHRGNSWTTHVFWVKQEVDSAWQKALTDAELFDMVQAICCGGNADLTGNSNNNSGSTTPDDEFGGGNLEDPEDGGNIEF